MTEQTAHQSDRPRNLSVYVPNTATRQRYIIRTRAQALRLGRPPLRDAPTNSPTKMSAPSSPLLAHKVGHKSGTLSRKRARSPSMQGAATNGSVKRIKPLVLTTSLKHSTTPVSPTKMTEGAFEVSEPPTARPSTPPRDRASTDATSTGRPVGQMPPKIIKPTSTIDVFDAEPVLQPPPQESGGSCHASTANAVHKSNEESVVVGPHEAPLPGPKPKLFDIRMCANDEQNVLKTGTSQLHRKYSTLSEDDTMVLNSPPKKAKTLTGPSVAAPKLSMIPRRVPPPGDINQPNIASLPPHAGLPSRELAPRLSSTVINESFPPTHPRPTRLLSPSTRTISSTATPSLREVPARPSTSLGFSNRRTSLHNSTQMSLSNLSTALEKLSLPRVRASLNGPGTVTSDSASSTGGPSAVAPQLGTDIKQKLKPPTLSSRSISGRLNGAATGIRRPIGLDEYFRIGLGRPSGGNMGPPRRTSSSIGPPPAPSAAVARATQAASTSRAFSLSSALPISSSPPTNPPTAPWASPGEASLTREDRRRRRASIASRSLADEGHLLRDVSTEDAVAAQKYDGKTDKKKLTKLTVLKDCVVYVDVKTEDGAGAGELFVNILKGLGARVCVIKCA